jgi:hypothetical protein
MTAPDLELMRRFGNEDVYADKLAGRSELVARLALGLIGYGSGRAELARQRSLQQQAAELNEAFERMQSLKLQQAETNARHTRVPLIIPAPVPGMRRWDGDSVPVGMDDGMVRLAAVAFDVGTDMAKEALSIQPLVESAKSIFGKIGPTVGKVMSSAAAPKAPTLAAAGQKITGIAQAAPKPPPAVGQAGAVLTGQAGLTGLGARLQSGLKQSGTTSLRGAAITAGGLALGGMAIKGALGGVRKGVDVMSREAGPAQWGGQQFGGSKVPYGINEYGQPDIRSPFM